MLIVEARADTTANQVTLTGPRLPGTVVVVLNRDDDDVTGDLDCPGHSKCIFVCSVYHIGAERRFEKYAREFKTRFCCFLMIIVISFFFCG